MSRFLKLLTLGLLCFGSFESLLAQSSALEAKAAYLLAEESYSKGDMHTTLQYLDQAATKLGMSNAKILYLKIMTLKELADKESRYGAPLDTAIAAFQKAPDSESFNEEKTMEVVKLKLERNRKQQQAAMLQKGFDAFQRDIGMYLGTSIDSIVAANPGLFNRYFQAHPKLKGKIDPNGIASIADSSGKYHVHHFKNNKLVVYMYPYITNYNETPDFSKVKQQLPAVLDKFRGYFGYLPEPKVVPFENVVNNEPVKATTYQYTWQLEKQVTLLQVQYITSKAMLYSTASVSLYVAE